MKIILRLLSPILVALVLIWTANVFAEYTRTRPIPGGAAEQLTVTLAHGSYTGPASIDEMTLCTPTGNPTLYLGSESNVNASNGYPLEGGACQHYKSGGRWIDPAQFWTFASSNSNIAITLR